MFYLSNHLRLQGLTGRVPTGRVKGRASEIVAQLSSLSMHHHKYAWNPVLSSDYRFILCLALIVVV